MEKEIPALGSLSSVFGGGELHPGPEITKEVPWAFEDLIFLRMNKYAGGKEIALARALYEKDRDKTLAAFISRQTSRVSQELKEHIAHNAILLSLIENHPELWDRFKRNCSVNSRLSNYLFFLSKI